MVLIYLDAVDLHSVGTLARRDTVLHFHPRQEVPPEGGAAGLQHLHVCPVGGEANLNKKNESINQFSDEITIYILLTYIQLGSRGGNGYLPHDTIE